MAESVNIAWLREVLRSPEAIRAQAFGILRNISNLTANPEQEQAAHEMILRALEYRDCFGPCQPILDSLVRAIGIRNR